MCSIETSQEIGKISAALLAFQAGVRGVVKDSRNPHFKNTYASLEAVIEAARPGLQAQGLAFLQAPGHTANGTIELSTMLMHPESGEWIRSTTSLPLAKQDPQGAGSAITYACRYALMASLGLPALDDDAEATRQQPEQKRPPEPPSRYPEPNGKPQRPLPEDETTRLPRPGKDSRSVYVENALERIQGFQNLNELNEWLDVDAEQVWPDFGITQHDPDGSKILMACKKRRLELKQPRAA